MSADRTETERLVIAAVRQQVLCQPDIAVRMLRRPRREDRSGRCAMLPGLVRYGLLAETQLRLSAPETAFATVVDAIGACGGTQLQVADRAVPQMLPIVAVWADLAVCIAHEDAVLVCQAYQSLAARAGDQRRVWLAAALRAVAVYHHEDGEGGHAELGQVLSDYRAAYGDDLISQMMAEAHTATAAGLPDGRYPHGPGAFRFPAPGGWLRPDYALAHRSYLASRVRLRSAARPIASSAVA